jgi:hypothetical protein
LVAENSKKSMRTLWHPPPLTVRKVFSSFKRISEIVGTDSGKHKGAVVKTLLAAGAVKKCWATCEGAGVEGCNLSRRGGEGDYQV